MRAHPYGAIIGEPSCCCRPVPWRDQSAVAARGDGGPKQLVVTINQLFSAGGWHAPRCLDGVKIHLPAANVDLAELNVGLSHG